MYSSTLSLTSGPGGGWVVSAPSLLYPLGKTQYPLYSRLGGTQGWSGQVQKISPLQNLIPGPSSPQQGAILTLLFQPTPEPDSDKWCVFTAYLQKSYIQHFNHSIIVKLYDLMRIVVSEHTTLLAHTVGRKLVSKLLDRPFCVVYVVDKVLLGQIFI